MIILDFQQVAISNIMVHLVTKTINKGEMDEELVRHMILNSIRSINNKFKEEYGNLVIAYDSRHSWRKKVFPYYKANRKNAQDKSPVDWIKLFDYFNRIKPELKQVLPYKVIEVEGAEADDIIGCLVKHVSNYEPVMIVSGDKDFIQLQGDNVKQYDPVQKKAVKNKLPPQEFLFEHIMRGDAGDGIPNVLSDDDAFVNPNKRQKPLTGKKMKMLSQSFDPVSDEINRNVVRNEQLIDLTKTPESLIIQIMDNYANSTTGNGQTLYKYLFNKNCKNLLQSIGDF